MFAISRLIQALFLAVFSSLLYFLRPAITTVKTTPAPSSPANAEGNVMPFGSVVVQITDIVNNAAPVFGNFGVAIYNGTTNTYRADDMVAGIIRRYGTQSAADLTATASDIVAQIPGAKVGQTFPLFIANLTSVAGVSGGVITPVANTGVTFVGTTTIDRASTRLLLGKVLGSASVSFTNCFQFPTPVI